MPTQDDQAGDPSRRSVGEPVAAYVVLSHREPEQVERLVAAIRRSSPRSLVLIAHDARHSRPPRALDDRVQVWEHGLRTDWGSWELVEATLGAFQRVREVAAPDLVALVSGADYPISNLAAWEREFVATGGGWVGEAHELRYRAHWGRRHGDGEDDLTRYTYRWIPLPSLGLTRLWPKGVDGARRRVRDAFFLRVEPLLSRRVVTRGRGVYLGLRRIRTPFSSARPCFKGSQWVALDRVMLDHLLAETGPGSSLARFYRATIIPDESLIPTVLSWSQPPREGVPLSYVEWVRALDEPRTLTLADLPALEASRAPFCRKVRGCVSDALLDALDALTKT